MNAYDAIVVGAGSAGAAAAAFLAESGLRTALVEKRSPDKAGARWVNGVPLWAFDEAGVARPTGPEARGGGSDSAFVIGAWEQAPRLRIESAPTVHVDMRHLVSRLQHRAKRAGVDWISGRVESVSATAADARTLHIATKHSETRLTAPLVVDASGLRGVLRHGISDSPADWAPPPPEFVCAAAQAEYAICDRAGALEALSSLGIGPGDSIALTGMDGGFSTLTLFVSTSLDHVGVLTGTITAEGAAPGLTWLERYVDSQAWIGERLFGGAGAIPLARPPKQLGHRGIALVGDAGNQVYAAHGSGVGLGLMAARMLANATARAQTPGSPASLRKYSETWHRRFGELLGLSDRFRRFSSTLSPQDIASMIDRGWMSSAAAKAALDQRPPPVELRVIPAILLAAARGDRTARKTLGGVARLVSGSIADRIR